MPQPSHATAGGDRRAGGQGPAGEVASLDHAWTPRFLPSIADTGRESWNRLFGTAAEGFDYYLACEKAPPAAFTFGALGVLDGNTLVAGAPAFRADFRLDMMLEGKARRLTDWVARNMPRFAVLPVLGAGSPHADELALAFDPGFDLPRRRDALGALLDALEQEAARTGVGMTFLKNVSDRDSRWAHDVLQRRGYLRVATLPIATLAIPATAEAYIDGLSANMRSNLRRKLKRAQQVRVEVRTSVDGFEEEIFELREATRRRASANYDAFSEISPGYIRQVLAHLEERARLLLYWHGSELIGFALVLLEPGRLIEKYNGMRYPEGPDYGVFFLNWMTQVRMCCEHGIPELHAGETTYLTKARLGCKLHRSWVYFRHRRRALNRMFALASRWIAFDSADPDLRRLGNEAPYA